MRCASRRLTAVAAQCASSGAFAQCTASAPGATGLCTAGIGLAAIARPQTGAYLGNQRVTSFAFLHSLQDRSGDTLYDGSHDFWLRGGGRA